MTTTFANRIVETSSTTGTGTLSLNGARAPYRSFRQGYPDGNAKTPVLVLNSGRTKWELSRNSTLTYGSPDTLTRNVVLSNNSNAAWSWTADDLPLTVLVPSDADVLEGAVTGWLATARHALLRFAQWVKDAYPSSGFKTMYWYNGSTDILMGTFVDAANTFRFDDGVLPYPKSYCYGLTWTNNGSDATNDIDITAGSIMSSDGTERIDIAATTKQLDVAWAVDTGATPSGMLDTGAVGNNEYYLHAIKNPTTGATAVLASLSSTAPTMPTGYTKHGLWGWVKRSAGANLAFKTYEIAGGGVDFYWVTPILDINLLNTLTTSRRTDALSVPKNFSTVAHIRAYVSDAGSTAQVILGNPDEADQAPNGGSDQPLATAVSVTSLQAELEIRLRTSATGTIATRATVATVDVYRACTIGFQWSRR